LIDSTKHKTEGISVKCSKRFNNDSLYFDGKIKCHLIYSLVHNMNTLS